ncbi:YoaK family protein [Acidiphilium iwatense]|uniref:DUF1275 domain-containing protein n=1 Tax=Acidiphilium iwatense TaxID=768198 RepID=A0ABS9DZR0_9PROT|nr:YoaK family protein [Acidiphilium iwatense]MCF3948242.1 DUF1275 domain-containing protein [Acidiphilium iwatense]
MADKANAPGVTPADRVVSLLGFASGSADVFAFIKFHGVFTSAMTGNTALLGLAVGQGHVLAAVRSLVALVGFSLGVVAGTALYDAGAKRSVRRLLVVEVARLAVVALLWAVLAHPVFRAPLFVLIVIAAAAMGVQSVVARAVDLPGITTVVFTTTLTMIMMGLTRVALRPGSVQPITMRQFGVLGWYAAGAAVSGFLAMALPDAIALPALAAAGGALAAMG